MRIVRVDGDGREWGARGRGSDVRVMTGELEGGMERMMGGTGRPFSTGKNALWSGECDESNEKNGWCVR